eukprot:3666724-Pyramimonas_sp.AAC.1
MSRGTKTAPRRLEMATEPPQEAAKRPTTFDYACLFLSPPVSSHGHRLWMGWWGYFFDRERIGSAERRPEV